MIEKNLPAFKRKRRIEATTANLALALERPNLCGLQFKLRYCPELAQKANLTLKEWRAIGQIDVAPIATDKWRPLDRADNRAIRAHLRKTYEGGDQVRSLYIGVDNRATDRTLMVGQQRGTP